jgi:type II restriction enzyme
LLVPRFSFSISTIEKRKPLSPFARRHGWIGCNIVLRNFPIDAKIPVVSNGVVADPGTVRKQYGRLRPLDKLAHDVRGWTLDLLRVLREIGKQEISLEDAYALERELARLHPQNLHVRDKIRQQLQRLRDLGFVEFLGRGRYRLT